MTFYPSEGAAWRAPLGAAIFALPVSIDTMGHRRVFAGYPGEAEPLQALRG